VDIQEYIKSGVIESYVLGMADAHEVAELEQLSHQHPEIRTAIDVFEADLEKAALNTAGPLPQHIKNQLFASLESEFAPEDVKQAPVVSMGGTYRIGKYIAAASVILLLGSAVLNVYFYTQLRSFASANNDLLVEKSILAVQNQSSQTKLLNIYQSMQLMSDPKVAKVSMPGIKGHEGNLVTVFWDTQSRDVYLLTNKLPEAAPDKQYQLWAIVDGKPVNAGMINACSGLCKMHNIPKASQFAITLEKRGGSETPTLDQMYVAGKAG
jgi:anti-sigma-K factor RskA